MSPDEAPSPPSLHVFGQRLAPILGTTPDALYERQRSLVRERLLRLEGRGRGGGTKATPQNVAMLVIAYMAADSPAEAGKRAKKLARAVPHTAEVDRFSGCKTFLDTLTSLVSGLDDHRKYPLRLSVARTTSHAMIEWSPDGSSFTGIPVLYSGQAGWLPEGVTLMATIPGGAFLRISRELFMLQRGTSR